MADDKRTATMTATTSSKCPICRKRVRLTKTLSRDLDGGDASDAIIALSRELHAWSPGPFVHTGCLDAHNRVAFLDQFATTGAALIDLVEDMVADPLTTRRDLADAESYLPPDEALVERLHERIASMHDLPDAVIDIDIDVEREQIRVVIEAAPGRDDLARIVGAFEGCRRQVTFEVVARTGTAAVLFLGCDGDHYSAAGRIIPGDAIVSRLANMMSTRDEEQE